MKPGDLRNLFRGTPARVCGVVAGACVVWVLGELGWFTPVRPWELATGWATLPETLRPKTVAPTQPGDPEIRWLGHAGFVLRWDNTVLLLDPNLSGHCTVSRRFMERPASPALLGHIDAALITHSHFDHLSLDTLETLKGLQSVALPSGSERFLTREALKHLPVVPLALGQIHRIGTLEVCAVPAAHNGNRYHPWRSTYRACGYVVRNAEGRTLYFAGDTAFKNDWAAIRETWRPELAVLPIGAYAPRIALKRHHLNPEEAVAAARALGVSRVIPCHMGTFRLSLDHPARALPRFARAAATAGLEWTMPMLLQIGDALLLTPIQEGHAP